jgi:hypothetical protein
MAVASIISFSPYKAASISNTSTTIISNYVSVEQETYEVPYISNLQYNVK